MLQYMIDVTRLLMQLLSSQILLCYMCRNTCTHNHVESFIFVVIHVQNYVNVVDQLCLFVFYCCCLIIAAIIITYYVVCVNVITISLSYITSSQCN